MHWESGTDEIGEPTDTFGRVNEPCLIQAGLLKGTRRGRVVTDRAYMHFGLKVQE